MDEDYAAWFAELIHQLYENRDHDRKIIFTEDDDKIAKRVYQTLVEAAK